MARIRTIKPEFWCHPIMAKQNDATRLMAIALLNYADDEGFFHAEPNLVRGFARPFDENSKITKECLNNLVKIGYISIVQNDDYGFIGLIEKFTEHQRVDRGNESKIKQYYSTNVRRIIDDETVLEGNREQGTGKGTGKGREFTPPTIEEIKIYFEEFGYTLESAIKAWNYYNTADWHDSKGNKVKNWKQKCQAVWFKDENKNKQTRMEEVKSW